MEYSKKIGPQQKKMEYGIFQKNSKKMYHNKKYANFGIWNIPWNIPGIFQKMGHNAWGRKV